jgi:hypothetical protein
MVEMLEMLEPRWSSGLGWSHPQKEPSCSKWTTEVCRGHNRLVAQGENELGPRTRPRPLASIYHFLCVTEFLHA